MKFEDLVFKISELNGRYCLRASISLKNSYSADILAPSINKIMITGGEIIALNKKFRVYIKNCEHEIIGTYRCESQSAILEVLAAFEK